MQLKRDGAQHFPAAIPAPSVAQLAHLFTRLAGRQPGVRLLQISGIGELIEPASAAAQAMLGSAARPVRATLFDKSAVSNWAVGWHQDRTIAVRRRVDQPGFVDWTVKSGIVHVVPPFAIVERMLTLRIHLDPVADDNAPLRIAPGTHRLGRIPEDRIQAIVADAGEHSCHAEAGDIWLYATPVLHASARAAVPARRRVIQILYSAEDLPGRLHWLGL